MGARLRLGFARAVAAYAALIFAFLGWLYLAEPLDHVAGFGISASGSPESANFLRTAPGALFAALASTALYGLLRPARLRAALWVLVLFNGWIVAARLFGMAVDGITPVQLSELATEGPSWLAFVAALMALPRAEAAAT